MKNEKMMDLPILKHFSEENINSEVDKFRKGEKGLFWFIKLAALGAIGYGLWVYVLPVVFTAIAQVLAYATTAIIIAGLVIAAPVIIKGLRRLTRTLHKAVIKHDPFAELENQRQKMLDNQTKFRKAKGKISSLKTEMEIEADQSEKDAVKLQTKILSLKSKADKIQSQMKELEKSGPAAKGTDEYVNLQSELARVLSDSSRVGHKMSQAKDFTIKYGSRAAIMKKFSQKMVMVETSMEIKILDFDATIEILKKDYEFAQKSREATESAKSAMLFTKGWELEYALDVVTTTIAEDIAVTAGNLNDIDMLTSSYAMDSDELYANLDILANNIESGTDIVPKAKDYSHPDYKLTHEDKIKSGGFENIF